MRQRRDGARRTARRSRASAAEPGVDALERAIAALLRGLGRPAATLVARRSGSVLPAASVLLLEHLAAAGTQRVSQIAACQQVGVPAVTPRLKELQAAGLIRRDADPFDARVSLISLTRAGRATLRRIQVARCELLAGAVAGLDPGAIAAAADVLRRVADALERRQPDAPG